MTITKRNDIPRAGFKNVTNIIHWQK